MAMFLVCALVLVRVLRPAERDLLTGLVLTFTFYAFFGASADHSWGYRHAFPVLGSAALLAASATMSLAGQRGGALVQRIVFASAVVAILIQLPVRASQLERSARTRSTTIRGSPAIAGLPGN
jgi:hypothetical protein